MACRRSVKLRPSQVFLNLVLSISLIVGFTPCVPAKAYADEPASVAQSQEAVAENDASASASPTDGATTAAGKSSQDAEPSSQVAGSSEGNQPSDGTADISTQQNAAPQKPVVVDQLQEADNSKAIEFVYVDQKEVSVGETQSVVVSFTDPTHAANSVLYYQMQGGELKSVKAKKVADGAALYEIAFDSQGQCGKYNLVKVSWGSSSSEEAAISNNTDTGYSFQVFSAPEESSEDPVTVYGLGDNGEVEEKEDLQSAVEELAQENESSTQSDENGIALFSADQGSSRSSKKMVVALDAGHGGRDGGAEYGGLVEKNLTLKIAQYCKAELDTYSNVTTYMTRTSNDEYVGLSERVQRAVNAGADLFVSFHINAASNATGFEVWVQNDSSWRYYLHTESSQLGSTILSKLMALGTGLPNRGNKESDSKSGNTYADGSPADYLTVLEQSRRNNIPAVLVEHGFIDGKQADRNLLSSENGLKSMGVADAKAIAEKYGLTKGAPKDAMISAKAHVSNIGWMSPSYDGDTAGTTGKNLPLEALQVKLENSYAKQGGVQVRAHVSNVGWQGWTSGTAGTTGQSKAIEAVQVKLTGDLASKYDVWYRVHSADYGWLGWAKNGASAGTEGYGKAAQAVQVKLVAKGGAAPGSTSGAFKKKLSNSEKAPIMGSSNKTVDQMVARFEKSGHKYPAAVYTSKGAGTIRDFCQIVLEESRAEGVKPEVLFAQAMWETGWLQFGGSVKADQCNFGGLGATNSTAAGATFSNVRQGLRAQVQHLKAYASKDALKNPCVDPRFDLVSRGSAPYLEDLNGKWAVPGETYGQNIRKIAESI